MMKRRIKMFFAVAMIAAGVLAHAQQYYWSNLTGTPGGSGSIDGAVGTARFNSPSAVAMDGGGNMYVADSANNTIRKITSTGVVTTLVGTPGVSGSSDGVGSAAQFNYPTGVAVDGDGNIYVADSGNYTIRKITPEGTVTTLAGSAGQYGSTDGSGGSALFGYFTGITVNGESILVADTFNHTIRQVATGGVVTTVVGNPGQPGALDGAGSSALFDHPAGVTVDGVGNIYVADTSNHAIRKITAGGVVTTLAGNPALAGRMDGTGTVALFNFPCGVSADAGGNVYVADTDSNTIRKVTQSGVVTTIAGTSGTAGMVNGTGTAASFRNPQGLYVDGNGTIYVADTGNQAIRKVSYGVVTTFAGSPMQSGYATGTGIAAQFNHPTGMVLDSVGNIYVADTYSPILRKVTSAGVVTTIGGKPGSMANGNGDIWSGCSYNYPAGMALELSGSYFYVADTYNHTIRKVATASSRPYTVTTFAGTAGLQGCADATGTAATFNNPIGLVIDSGTNLYVADSYNHTIRQITAAGVVTTIAGTPNVSGTTDGIGGDALFNYPTWMAIDSGTNLYVADSENYTIRKLTLSGSNWTTTTLAGSVSVSGTLDGAGTAAQFGAPAGLAADGNGNIYVADSGNNTIRMVTQYGVVTTIGGMPGVIGGADGIGSSAQFSTPCGIAVNAAGIIYVADSGNNRITVGSFVGTQTATSIATTTATLNGAANPNGTSTSAYFQYGTTTTYGKVSGTQSLGDGSEFVAVPASLTGLTANTIYHYRIVITNANGTFYGVDQTFTTLSSAVPAITSAAIVTGTATLPFTYTIAASNAPSSFGASGLPAGLSVNPLTGVISGIPLTAGTSSVILSATNVVGTGTKGLTLTIVNMPLPVFSSPTAANAVAGCSFVYNISANNYTTSYSATGLPTGCTVNPSTGAISGAPATPGTYYVTLGATNISGTGTTTLTITVIPSYYWHNIVGQPTASGSADGAGSNARFYHPYGIAVDSGSNLYVVDTNNSTVRRITRSGTTWNVTTIAGSAGSSGTADGIGSAARFYSPGGIAVDSGTNLYVSDTYNSTIRKISQSGSTWNVTTIAGSPRTNGTADGAGSAALFYNPQAIAVDSGTNLYVVDTVNYTVRRISQSGSAWNVTTIAGVPRTTGTTDGAGSVARFNYPYGIAVDSGTNLYVADNSNSTVRKITKSGSIWNVTTIAGSAGSSGTADGIGSAAKLYYPRGITVDSGTNLYVTDTYNYIIRKISKSGAAWNVTTIGGNPRVRGTSDGFGSSAGFYQIAGIAVGASGNVYVTDYVDDRISEGISQWPPAITSALTTTGTSGSAFSYTITANNNPNSYNATGLPSGLSVDTATGVISGTATASGTFSAAISAINWGGTVRSTLTLTIQSPFGAWKSRYFTPGQLADPAISSDTAAPASDGVANMMKYAIGLTPWEPVRMAVLPAVGTTNVGGTNYLTLTYAQNISATDITCFAEVSADLLNWHSGAGYTMLVNPPVNNGNGTQTVVERDLTPMSSSNKRFIRLKVTTP